MLSPVPVQYREHELRHILNLVQAKIFVTVPKLHGFDHAAMGLGLQRDMPFMAYVAVFGADAPERTVSLDGLLRGRSDGA